MTILPQGSPQNAGGRKRRQSPRIQAIAWSAFGSALLASAAFAAPPPAGTVIGNQAVATFESGGQTISVTSNLVETTINAIASVDIEPDNLKLGVAGGKVFFAHVITNTGNIADIYTLSTDLPTTNLTEIAIYGDDNCDGVPEALVGITQTVSLNPGESTCIVVEVDVDSGVTPATANESFTVTATTTLPAATTTFVNPSDFSTDTVDFTTGPAFKFDKKVEFAPGGDADGTGTYTPGDTLRVTLTYNNYGQTDATNVTVVDALPAGLTYLAGTGLWSDDPDALTETGLDGFEQTNGSGQSIDYSYDGTDTVTAVIDLVPDQKVGSVRFDVTIDSDASGTITNVGTIADDDNLNPQPSNPVPIEIDQNGAIAVTLNDVAATDTSYAGRPAAPFPGPLDEDNVAVANTPASSTDEGTLADDTVAYETTAIAEGAVVPFELVITNHSNTGERFNFSTAIGSFPAGTTFTYFTAGGASIIDTNTDGMPDMFVGANTATTFFVRADLPAGATRVDADPDWVAIVTAAAVANPAASNQTRLLMGGDVVGAAVDLQNPGSFSVGVGNVDNGGLPWTTTPTDPGTAAVFTLNVFNNGLLPDSFNLAFSSTNFAAGSMPSGWQVVFKDGSGNTISNTGVIAGSGGTATVFAHVTPPASASPGTQNVFFRVQSATNSSVQDVKLDAVTVNDIVDLAIRTDRTGQAAPGGVVVLSHTLENVGNVPIIDGAITFAPGFPTFSEAVYLDVNGDGALDGGDVVVTSIADIIAALPRPAFEPGFSVVLFDRVQVPTIAVAGLSETATIMVSTSLTKVGGTGVTDGFPVNNSVSDTVTVVSGHLQVIKEQALQGDCAGALSAFTQALQTADPGDCIVYRVTATNLGTAGADAVQIDDQTPAYTTYVDGFESATTNGVAAAPGITVEPANGATGAIRSEHGTLIPSGQAILTFKVKIDE